MNRQRKEYIQSCEVSELAELKLGGYKQKVLIEGRKKDLPVVIVLHGGPGSPVPFSVGCRGLFPEWTSKAVMVFWDQLGCGINNCDIKNLNIENFVQMTCDLVEEIKSRFPQNKLYLFGVSWGSVLALKAAVCMHEKLDGAFVYGQILKNLFFNDEIAGALSAIPAKAKNAATKILHTGTDCDYATLDKNLQTLYKILNKYTNAYNNKNSKPAPVGLIIRGLLKSPDYTFKDFKAIMVNGYRQNQILWRELLSLDLSSLFAELKIKYLILQGDTDIVTSTKNVIEAVKVCGNENVSVKVLKNSGHMPSAEAMAECFRELCDFVV